MSWLGGQANAAWDWIAQNRQWVFSGIGVMVLGVGWWLLNKVFNGSRVDSAPTPNLPPVNDRLYAADPELKQLRGVTAKPGP